MLSLSPKMHVYLQVVPLLQTYLHILHLGTATDSHIPASWTPWTFHVLVIPPENRIRLIDRGALRLVDSDAKRWAPEPMEVAGLHFE